MCYTDPFNTPAKIREELDTEEIFRILDELQEAGCVELTLTGGEPLARPDFIAIYERAYQLGFLITVFTNGTLITRKIIDSWTKAPPRRVEISLHGITAETFDRVTQVPGSFERCLEWIRVLIVQKIPLVLKTVALTLNRDEILKIKHVAESLGQGVQWQFGQYLRDDLALSGAPFQFELSEEELQEIEKRNPELWKAKCDEIIQSRPTQECSGGMMRFHIDAYGQLQLCSNNRRGGYNLRKGDFRHGFYEVLPHFPCPRRSVSTNAVLA